MPDNFGWPVTLALRGLFVSSNLWILEQLTKLLGINISPNPLETAKTP
jgi:hypothetical protein